MIRFNEDVNAGAGFGGRTILGTAKPFVERAVNAPGLFLLFGVDRRPDRADLHRFAQASASCAISHDPAAHPNLRLVAEDGERAGEVEDIGYVEILREGLTFDIRGLGAAPGLSLPPIEHVFDLDQTPNDRTHDILFLSPGSHLAGGERSLPVLRGLMSLAGELIHFFDDLQAVVWPPSRSAIGRRFFDSTVMAWIEGGPFPALGLTAFAETMDGSLQTLGLAHLIGQELRIEPPLARDKVAATRLGVRLVNQLVLTGGCRTSEQVIAPDGTRLEMRPSRNGRFVRVWSD